MIIFRGVTSHESPEIVQNLRVFMAYHIVYNSWVTGPVKQVDKVKSHDQSFGAGFSVGFAQCFLKR